MKTLGPAALGATCLGLQLISNPVEGFIATPAAGPGVQARRQQKLISHLDADVKSISLGRGAFVQHRRRASCGTTTCRMMMSGGFGQPAGDSGASGKASTKKGKGKGAAKEGSRAPAAGEEEQKGTGQRQLFMQFTCNRCEGVSQYMINKTAYEEGIVICTCQQCKVKHLIADNLKKMDFPAFGDNIEEYMQATGTPEEVTKGRAPDLTPEIVEKYDVAMGKDGVLSLSPKAGVDAVDDSPSSTA